MGLLTSLVNLVARRLNLPPEAVKSFHAANRFSGLNTRTAPTELVPLNSLQFARGILNYVVMQTLEGWLFPFWAEQQYDPRNPAFVPRSHLGLSMNVTHRNWTGVGSPEAATEPIVDPRGLLTPFRNCWSVDFWLHDGKRNWFPSRTPGILQEAVEDLPVVRTSMRAGPFRCTATAATHGSECALTIKVTNGDRRRREARLAIAIRPFNPEGIALVHTLRFDKPRQRLVVNEAQALWFDALPSAVHCSSFAGGDSVSRFPLASEEDACDVSQCPSGLANGFAEFRIDLLPGTSRTIGMNCNLERPMELSPKEDRINGAIRAWKKVLAAGAKIETPDQAINRALRTATATLVMLSDGSTITPGPFTYHHFWIRDAAIMLSALDALGFHTITRPVIEKYAAFQDRSGFYRSQQGEWDANGEVLWSSWRHSLLSGELTHLVKDFDHLSAGAKWIDRALERRPTDPEIRQGLLPAGLSAEHLGLSAQYYWDDFWALAGLRSFVQACSALERPRAAGGATETLGALRGAVDASLAADAVRLGSPVMPAGPGRGIDSGMIGSLIAGYPLHLFPPNHPGLSHSHRAIAERFLLQGLFHQKFVHSGLNPYLTLQIAQNSLYRGDRHAFYDLLLAVLRRGSSTGTYPEAIHPLTGGGCMGDGHHGWAAAEVAMAVRNMFVWDEETPEGVVVHLLGGIPAEWLGGRTPWDALCLPVPGGVLSMRYRPDRSGGMLGLEWAARGFLRTPIILLHPPSPRLKVVVAGNRLPIVRTRGGISLPIVEGEQWIALRGER